MKYPLKRIFRVLCLRIATHVPMDAHSRLKFVKLGGVNIKDTKRCSIGDGVILDSLYPENIIIHNHVHITMNCVILTHFLDTTFNGIKFKSGIVELCDDCFIGANTVICNAVRIGKNSIVGAGSVVTKDVPDNEIWAGNPARFIKRRV